jgi:hypothetical protein
MSPAGRTGVGCLGELRTGERRREQGEKCDQKGAAAHTA